MKNINTSNPMFKRKTWDKFTEFTFLYGRFENFKKNERDKFSPNFTNKHVIPG